MSIRILSAVSVLAALAGALCAPAIAGPYDQPYAIVETGGNSETRKEARVTIGQVDGKSTRNPRKTDPIPPGKHQIKVNYESARGVRAKEFELLEMDLEGCTRYRVVAVYESKTGPDWNAKVYSEPIGECVSKFKKKADKEKAAAPK